MIVMEVRRQELCIITRSYGLFSALSVAPAPLFQLLKTVSSSLELLLTYLEVFLGLLSSVISLFSWGRVS